MPSMTRPPVRVGVVGSVNQDRIVQADGLTSNSLGGILFTAGALARLGTGHGIEAVLLARVGQIQMPQIQAQRRLYPSLCLDGLTTGPEDGFRCQIRYHDDGTKEETLLGEIPPMAIRDLAPELLRLQGLVVNFITGFELNLQTLAAVRRALQGLLLIDYHSLTLARDVDGRRHPDCPSNWRSWLAMADVVQMNVTEARILGADAGIDGAARFARRLLGLGPTKAVITLGAAGSVGAWRDADGRTQLVRQAAVPCAGPVIDTTGCGDVFLAGMAVGLFRGSTLQEAMNQGAMAAAGKCTRHGLNGLLELQTETVAESKV